MPKHSAPSNEPEINLSPPNVIDVLPAVPGGEENLLPKDAWLRPLCVEFGWWDDPSPLPGFSDIVQLIWDGDEANPVDEKPYEGSDPPTLPPDLWLQVPVIKLDEGIHSLRYRLIPWHDPTPRDSVTVNVTIDKTAPVLATASELGFPTEVLPPSNKLTARYLEQNNDQLKAALPAYTAPRPWDRITWYWGKSPASLEQGGVIELDDKNYSDPVVIIIAGELIRDRGNGWRYAWYQVHDRAGNESLRSEPVELDVDATPIPRTLPPSKITQATGGVSSGVLSPSNAINGVTVTIPPEAVIYDDEKVFVQWAEQGSEGGYRTDTPITAGGREYKIPSDKIHYHVNRSLPVSYEVFEPGVVDPHTSRPYTLTVEGLSGMPTIQCDKVSGDKLSLTNIPARGFANFTLASWTFMSTAQYLTITVEGLDTNSQKLVIPVLTQSPVPEVAQVISVGRISKADLQRFRLNVGFEVRVEVSFDNKQTWQSFPMLTPTLVA